MYAWIDSDPDAVRVWAEEHLDRGDWPLLDLLARLVSRMVPMGVLNPPNLVGELELADVEKVVGLERARRELASNVAACNGKLENRALATPENRRAAVLQTLKALRDENV